MNQPHKDMHLGLIKEFLKELGEFIDEAEKTLKLMEEDLDGKKHLFSIFSKQMFKIRGTSLQLGFPHLAHIASLGEEIAYKAPKCTSRAQIRKCIGALWDSLTSLHYMLRQSEQATTSEQMILLHRLEDTLRRLGGARPVMSALEIEQMLAKRNQQ